MLCPDERRRHAHLLGLIKGDTGLLADELRNHGGNADGRAARAEEDDARLLQRRVLGLHAVDEAATALRVTGLLCLDAAD